jgi:hypothetical protein
VPDELIAFLNAVRCQAPFSFDDMRELYREIRRLAPASVVDIVNDHDKTVELRVTLGDNEIRRTYAIAEGVQGRV